MKILIQLVILSATALLSIPATAKVFDIAAGDVYGPNGLVQAINKANASQEPDTINLAAGTYAMTAVNNNTEGPNGLPSIISAITIKGQAPTNTVVKREGSDLFRILYVGQTGALTLEGISLMGGMLPGLDTRGGNVLSRGIVVINQTVITGSRAGEGGGIDNFGKMHLRNTDISSNDAFGGAGIANEASGLITVLNTMIRGNDAQSRGGGGILNDGEMILNAATVSLNTAFDGSGGGIRNSGRMTVFNSVVNDNQVGSNGGGILNGGSMNIINSTVSGNTGSEGGVGGISNSGTMVLLNTTINNNFGARFSNDANVRNSGTLELKNTIIANGHTSNGDLTGNCSGVLISRGNNLASDKTCSLSPNLGDLSGADPLLGPLQDNGGPTLTHASSAGSLTIDRGDNKICPASDQRGAIRPKGAGCDIGAFESGTEKQDLANLVRSTVGGRDEFHSDELELGSLIDHPLQSPRVQQLVKFISADPGQDAGVDLDIGGANRPVGLTHYFGIPAQARITQAILKARVKSADLLVYNDGILYDDSKSRSEANPDCLKEPPGPTCLSRGPILPVIALRDLLGGEPQAGIPLDLQVNLGRAPVRTVDTTGGPGGHWSANPNEYRDLLSRLLDGEWNLVFSDDLTVDWSELTITYIMPGAKPGDLNGDGRVDRNDLNMLYAVLNTKAYGPDDPRDLDHDGFIRLLDVNKLIFLCTTQQPRCATQ